MCSFINSFQHKQFLRYFDLKFKKEMIFQGGFSLYEIPEGGGKISNVLFQRKTKQEGGGWVDDMEFQRLLKKQQVEFPWVN